LAKNLRGLANLGQFGTNGFFWKTIVVQKSFVLVQSARVFSLSFFVVSGMELRGFPPVGNLTKDLEQNNFPVCHPPSGCREDDSQSVGYFVPVPKTSEVWAITYLDDYNDTAWGNICFFARLIPAYI
jgi:hypothetical protein